MGQSWLDAPPVIEIVAVQGGSGVSAQAWAITDDYQLIFTQEASHTTRWSPWSKPDWDGAPAQVFAVAAAQQGDGRVQIFVLDDDMRLWTAWQLTPGGGWSGFAGPNWNGASKLQRICASAQGGDRRAQIFGIDDTGAIVSCYQATPGGGDWSDWYPFDGPSPAIEIAAAMQNDPRVQMYVTDEKQSLWTNWQTAPGNGWAGWDGPGWNTPPGPLQSLAAASQGGPRGAQVWATDGNMALWTCYQAVSGDDWSGWIGPAWESAPAFAKLAAAQLSDGSVQAWGIDTYLQIWTIVQDGPGGDWGAWMNC